MKLLLDTHLLLWAALGPDELPAEAVNFIEDRGNELFFSAASIWEIAIKAARGKPDFVVDTGRLRLQLRRYGYQEVPVTAEHAVATAALPLLHKDPFDRLLVAQASVQDLLLLTADEIVARYPGPIRKV